jgi:hypothetical protein
MYWTQLLQFVDPRGSSTHIVKAAYLPHLELHPFACTSTPIA